MDLLSSYVIVIFSLGKMRVETRSLYIQSFSPVKIQSLIYPVICDFGTCCQQNTEPVIQLHQKQSITTLHRFQHNFLTVAYGPLPKIVQVIRHFMYSINFERPHHIANRPIQFTIGKSNFNRIRIRNFALFIFKCLGSGPNNESVCLNSPPCANIIGYEFFKCCWTFDMYN